MSSSPVVVLAIIGIYVMVYMVLVSAGPPEAAEDLDEGQDPGNQPSNVVEIVLDVVQKVWDFVKLLFGALFFNVDGAPAWVQFPVAVMLNGSLGWSIVTLIRGGAG